MEEFNPKGVPEEHWHQLKGNRAYAIKCDEDRIVHLRFGIGGLFIAVGKGEEKELIVSSINLADGNLTEVARFGQNKIMTLGRSSDCQIRISHPILSRKHVELSVEGNVLVVKDLGSTNGSFCHSENFFFDIEDYISKHVGSDSPDSTMDEIHEAFGPPINDFLKKRSEQGKVDTIPAEPEKPKPENS